MNEPSRMGPGEFRAILEHLGWSVDDASRHLMVDRRTIFIWRSGERKVSGPATAFLRYLLRIKTNMPAALCHLGLQNYPARSTY